MKLSYVAVAGIIFTIAGCQEKVPPIGPLVATPNETLNTGDQEEPPQCEPDCSSGSNNFEEPTPGFGLTGWKYLWQDPASFSSVNSAVTNMAARPLYWWNGGDPPSSAYDRKRMPILIDQDGQADQFCVAKAICYRAMTSPGTITYTDSNCPNGQCVVSYYDEVWHAIRNMLKSTTQTSGYFQGGCPSGNWGGICANGWLGMSRNLLGYLVAADYLMSMGPASYWGYKSGGVGSGMPYQLHNWATYDSLRTFVYGMLAATGTNQNYTVPRSCECTKGSTSASTTIKDMLNIPDNKGAGALASYIGLAALGKNMQNNPLLYKANGIPWCEYNYVEWCAWGNATSYDNWYTDVTCPRFLYHFL